MSKLILLPNHGSNRCTYSRLVQFHGSHTEVILAARGRPILVILVPGQTRHYYTILISSTNCTVPMEFQSAQCAVAAFSSEESALVWSKSSIYSSLVSQFADCCSRRGLSVDHQALTWMLSICVNLYTLKQASMLQWLEISMAGRALEVMSLDINSLAGCGFNTTSWYYITPGISFQLPRRVVAQAGTWAKAIGALWFLKLCLCEGTQTPEAHRTLGGQHQALRRRWNCFSTWAWNRDGGVLTLAQGKEHVAGWSLNFQPRPSREADWFTSLATIALDFMP